MNTIIKTRAIAETFLLRAHPRATSGAVAMRIGMMTVQTRWIATSVQILARLASPIDQKVACGLLPDVIVRESGSSVGLPFVFDAVKRTLQKLRSARIEV